MWQFAADVVSGDGSQPIIVALISALGGVLVAAVGALVSVARRESHEPTPTAALPSLGERVAVLERRADDTDDALELQDRRLDREERRMEDGARRLARLERIDNAHNPTDRRD